MMEVVVSGEISPDSTVIANVKDDYGGIKWMKADVILGTIKGRFGFPVGNG